MRVTIKGKEIQLDNREVKSAKKITLEFIERVKAESEKSGQPTYYFTMLLIMHLLSQDLIDELGEKQLALIVNSLNEKKNL